MSTVAKRFTALIGAAMLAPLGLVTTAPAVATVDAARAPAPAPSRSWEAVATPLSAAGRSAYEPDVVVGGDGVTTAVWTRAGRVQARQQRNGLWQATVTLGRGGHPQVDADTAGNVTVVWETSDVNIVSRRKPHNRGWQPTVVLQGGGRRWSTGAKGGMDPAIDVSPSGHVLVAWAWGSYDAKPYSFQNRIRSASPTGDWGRIVKLPGTDVDPGWPQPAVGRRGWGAVLFYDYPRLKVSRHLPGGGSWSTPQNLGRASMSDIAMSPSGATTVVYRRGGGEAAIVYGRYAEPGGAFLSETRLSAEAGRSSNPQVAMDKYDKALAVWWEGTAERVGFADNLGNGPWTSNYAMDLTDVDLNSLHLAMNTNGDAAVAVSFAPNGSPDDTKAWVTMRPLEAGWSAPESATPSGGYSDGYDLQLAMQPDWQPVAVWTTASGGHSRVMFNEYTFE